jgi:hypothetical protein
MQHYYGIQAGLWGIALSINSLRDNNKWMGFCFWVLMMMEMMMEMFKS